jgi:hypothetical protein
MKVAVISGWTEGTFAQRVNLFLSYTNIEVRKISYSSYVWYHVAYIEYEEKNEKGDRI